MLVAAPSFWPTLFPAFATIIAGSIGGWIALQAIKTNRQIARLRATLDLIERTESEPFYLDLAVSFKAARLRGFDYILDPQTDENWQERKKVFLFLNHYEMTAIGIKNGVLDETFYAQFRRGIVVRDWRYAREFIGALRSKIENPTPSKVFEHFSALAQNWDWEIRHEQYLRTHGDSEEKITKAIEWYRAHPKHPWHPRKAH